MDRSFIEVDFPVKQVSAESAREKNIRHGHISTLHIWWARRPLASSRASIYAALTPEPANEQEREERCKFISELCKWENSLNPLYIDKAREDILEANGGVPPKVLDPFAGGGAIPLEALRLGCEAYASDLNPVAALIEKATLEYPQKFGQPKLAKEEGRGVEVETNPLLEAVKNWGAWVLKEAMSELAQFYPPDTDGSISVGYIWARTLSCHNPACGAEIPLMRQTWLAKKSNKKVALRMLVDKSSSRNRIDFEVVEEGDIDFDAGRGTVSGVNVVCSACGSGIDDKTVRKEAQEGRMGERMVVVVLHKAGQVGKRYRLATEDDFAAYKKAEKFLAMKRTMLAAEWGIEPIPDELMPDSVPGGIHPPSYGLLRFGNLFNARQGLALITFADKVRRAHVQMQSRGIAAEEAQAVATYLAFAVDRLADYDSCVTSWHVREYVRDTFPRPALQMVWDYFEINPGSGATGDWNSAMGWILRVIEHCCSECQPAEITQASATAIPYPDKYFDAVITDPPYYYSVIYADLADFFYVWLKRTLPKSELMSTPLTPKTDEIIQGAFWDKARFAHKDGAWFEAMLTKSFKEVHRVLKPTGIACIVFAQRSTSAWEAVVNAILKAGLYLTASWPVRTEMQARMMARESAALASSIYMVCRKRMNHEIAYFNDIRPAIEQRIHEKLDQFWAEGIGGSDFFISAIGPAIEVFGKYERVEKLSGEQVTAAELLELVRRIVSEYALSRILNNPNFAGIDNQARFYLLWRWTYDSAKLPFDEARKLSQAVGLELTEHWNKGFVKKEKEFIRVLDARERGSDFLKQQPEGMVDILHQALLFWERNDRAGIRKLLEETGHLGNNDFWQLAQAISEVLPDGDKEKQMLQGFLYGRETYARASAGPGKAGQDALF